VKRLGATLAILFAVLALTGCAAGQAHPRGDAHTEVVVRLSAQPLAFAPDEGARIDSEQRAFRAALAQRIPDARVRWRYRLVEDGLAVVVRPQELPVLRALPWVRQVYESASYAPEAEASPGQIGAPAVWGSNLATAGQGVKIGIIDSGVDARHPFFDPSGYTMPAGFPKGQRAYTTTKVIVARSFPPPGAPARDHLAFARGDASHGTHVAGIAAGDANTRGAGHTLSGVAPKAYIGNYKAFVPTVGGPNAGAAEIVAAIEAAVADGMDVINFSGGEAEVEPSRDIVARALDAAAAKGVVPVVAAGNWGSDQGPGSVSSPGSSAGAITAGAVEFARNGAPVVADFSSIGPTPISLRLKPDVAAPGAGVLSSVPGGGWGLLSGTSMAAPHVAGAAALLRQRHPTWSVAQIKAALVETGRSVRLNPDSAAPAVPAYVGGGLVSLQQADQPLVFASPSSVSLGLWAIPASDETLEQRIALQDAGGGGGTWQASIERLDALPGVSITLPTPFVDVPGELQYDVTVDHAAAQGDISGSIVLRRGTDLRRIPFWGRVTAPGLSRHRSISLTRTGLHTGSTRGQASLVTRYRYPADPRAMGVHVSLGGPELVYRVHVAKRVANFGVVITRESRGTAVEPRVVEGLDENRLTGIAALPVVINPWLDQYGARVRVAGALVPRPGDYGIVFDSVRKSGAGRFTFRFWVNDTTPPKVKLLTPTVRSRSAARLSISDWGSGVFPQSLAVYVDGRPATFDFRGRILRVPTSRLTPGAHRLRVVASDYQETRNVETIAGILPNTRTFVARIAIGSP
jgi:subtilisin family serine protease